MTKKKIIGGRDMSQEIAWFNKLKEENLNAHQNFTQRGISGLYLLAKYLERKHSKCISIAMPNYTCWEIVEKALRGINCKIHIYEVDLLDCRKTINIATESKCHLTVIVDYFGTFLAGTDIKYAASLASGEVLIDSVHNLWRSRLNWLESNPEERNVSIIYSLRKSIPAFSGGILESRHLFDNHKGYCRNENSILKIEDSLINDMDLPAIGRRQLHLSLETNLDVDNNWISEYSMNIFTRTDYKSVRNRRIENCLALVEGLNKNKTTKEAENIEICLSDKPKIYNDSMPLYYPMLFRNVQERDYIASKLISERIYPVVLWPAFQGKIGISFISSLYGECGKLKILCLPIDQRYDKYDMKHIIDVIYS